MLCGFEMFAPYFLIQFERYVTDAAFKSAGSCVGCLGVVDAALSAIVAKEGTDVCHVVATTAVTGHQL